MHKVGSQVLSRPFIRARTKEHKWDVTTPRCQTLQLQDVTALQSSIFISEVQSAGGFQSKEGPKNTQSKDVSIL